MTKQFKNISGMSLVEVTMAAGLLGIIGFFVSSLMDTQFKGQKSAETSYETTTLTSEIRNLISSPAACLKTLGGLNPVDNPTLAINSIKKKDATDKYVVGNTYGNNTLKITGISLAGWTGDLPSVTSPEGTAQLTLNFEKTGNVLGNKTVSKTFEVQVGLVGSGDRKIASCFAIGSPQDFATKEYVDAATGGSGGGGGSVTLYGVSTCPTGWENAFGGTNVGVTLLSVSLSVCVKNPGSFTSYNATQPISAGSSAAIYPIPNLVMASISTPFVPLPCVICVK